MTSTLWYGLFQIFFGVYLVPEMVKRWHCHEAPRRKAALPFPTYMNKERVSFYPTVDCGKLFLNQKAYNALQDLLNQHGEFLPVTYEDNEGYLFNVLALADSVDGVDHKLSTKNEYGDLQSLAFHGEKVKHLAVFRTSFDDFMGLFCQQEFKEKVEQAGLAGVTFREDLGNIFPPDPTAQGAVA